MDSVVVSGALVGVSVDRVDGLVQDGQGSGVVGWVTSRVPLHVCWTSVAGRLAKAC